MKYFEVNFTISPYSSDAGDVLAAMAGEAGFETFEETETGMKGYVQQQLFDETALKTAIEEFPFMDTTVTYEVQEAEDKDWNEQWEQEGFEPILISDKLMIHDGRHLPDSPAAVAIEIDAKLAFGTGTHETTRMICASLLEMDLSGKRILDGGTGTGILSICALKLGAQEAVGYDIDEWSVDNAHHNAVINSVDDHFTALLGDASILLNKVEGYFDVVLANINRNILLADLPLFRQKMAQGSMLILSGFYTDDCQQLVAKAQALGLTFISQKEDHDWASLCFRLV
jgi:ribosomal protein L11 methyltransferase